MFTALRPITLSITRRLGVVLVVVLIAPAIAVSSASAAPTNSESGRATCPGQVFSQPFAAYGDTNEYTLAPGGLFNSPSEGWELSNGAQIVSATQPNGTRGGVLNLPSGAVAVSPPMCVTLAYQTARAWVHDVKGWGGVELGVAYAGTNRTVENPQEVGLMYPTQGEWTPASAIFIWPQIAGYAEGTREVQFVLTSEGYSSDFQLDGLYVDPSMR